MQMSQRSQQSMQVPNTSSINVNANNNNSNTLNNNVTNNNIINNDNNNNNVNNNNINNGNNNTDNNDKSKDSKRKRPANAFLLYNREMRSKVLEKNPGMDVGNISKAIGKGWHSLTEVCYYYYY